MKSLFESIMEAFEINESNDTKMFLDVAEGDVIYSIVSTEEDPTDNCLQNKFKVQAVNKKGAKLIYTVIDEEDEFLDPMEREVPLAKARKNTYFDNKGEFYFVTTDLNEYVKICKKFDIEQYWG